MVALTMGVVQAPKSLVTNVQRWQGGEGASYLGGSFVELWVEVEGIGRHFCGCI